MTKRKHLYLVDGSGYIFRAYYGLPPLSNSAGLPTNALHGYTQMLLKFLKETRPTYIAVAFDTKEPTFRDQLYDQYKANRKQPPEDLVPQFPYFQKITRALSIQVLVKPGYEADDLIGTVAKKAQAEGMDVTLISGDKDLMQLISEDDNGPSVTMWDTMRNRHYSKEGVVEKFGVPPSQVIEVMGLQGDSSDNIPGVVGVGPKTAAKLIQEYGSLEGVLSQTQNLKGKLKERIEANKEMARLSKKLATIEINAAISFSVEDFSYNQIVQENAFELFQELEFTRLFSVLDELVSAPTSEENTPLKKRYQLILDQSNLRIFLDEIKKAEFFSFDLETDSLNKMKANIVGVALGYAPGKAAYIPVAHVNCEEQLNLKEVLKELKPIFEDATLPKVAQNAKYDLTILKRFGVEVKGVFCDTMIASYILNPRGPHNLDDLSQKHLNQRTIKYAQVVGSGAKKILFSEVGLELATEYAGEDADYTWQLAEIFMKSLKDEKLINLFEDIEMPLMNVLLKMEMFGVKVDASLLKSLSLHFGGELEKLEASIYEMGGEAFNINSPKQLQKILFEKLKLPVVKKTKTGYSTNQAVLETLASHHSLPASILKFRTLGKLKSTYTDALQDLINVETGRIHTSFNQTVAETGRLSSSEPNLQNIPIRNDEGRSIRSAFIVEPDYLLLSADYSQIELRILAHLSKDPTLVSAFLEGRDIHSQTAASIFGLPLEALTREQRSIGKTINFATLYGQGAFSLSKQLKISASQASDYIKSYFERYPEVEKTRDEILEEGRRRGYVETILGRRRYIPDLLSPNKNIAQNAQRVAFNAAVQGSAADVIKLAMLRIDEKITRISSKAKMILQVHDELVFEVPESDAKSLGGFVKKEMESAYTLNVPLVVELGRGKNWSQAH